MNLNQLIRHSSRNYPEKIAIIEGTQSITYAVLMSVILEIGADLRTWGMVKGDRVGLRLPNGIAYVAISFAIWEAGGIVVPVGMELNDADAAQIIDTLCLDVFISDTDAGADISYKCPATGTRFYCRRLLPGSRRPFAEKDIAFIRFTSGTTGSSKGVVLGHRTILDRISAVNKAFQITEEETVIWLLSMAHHFVSTILLFLANNATVAVVNTMLAGAIIDTINRVNGTIIYGTPFYYSLLASDTSGRRLPTLKRALSTTIDLSDDIFQKFYQRYDLPIAQAYGIIELGIVCINTTKPSEKRGSVGTVLPDYRISIRHSEAYRHGSHTCGDIYVKGPGFFDAYASPWAEASSIMADGWFDTGDVGWVDDEGYVFLVARRKHIINTAGMKVFPQEVETVVNAHPGVRETRVYAKAHARFGEIVACDVVPSDAEKAVKEADIIQFCRERLSMYKIPQEICFVDWIRKTPVTSKIVRTRRC